MKPNLPEQTHPKKSLLNRFNFLKNTRPVVFVAIFAVLGVALTIFAHAETFTVLLSSDPTYPEKVDFVVSCQVTNRANDDPIVYPGVPGASHNHTFAGNSSANAYSTPQILAAGTSSCKLTKDRSLYWTPTLYADGVAQIPTQTRAYYRAGTNNGPIVKPLPFGLKMIAGNPNATSAQNGRIARFHCRDSTGAITGEFATPPACPQGSFLEGSIVFPNCWDGVNLDSADHRSHMSYGPFAAPYTCDTAHPIELPQLTIAQRYPIDGTLNKVVTLATHGDVTLSKYTLHADFVNAWEPGVMGGMTLACINASTTCADMTDGRYPPNYVATTDGTPPVVNPASNFKAVAASSTQIDLSWTASTSTITGYIISRNGVPIKTVTPDMLAYSDTGLTSATAYNYDIKAVNSSGIYSGIVSASDTTNPGTIGTIVAPPTNFAAAAASPNQINLSWVPSASSITSYVLLRNGATFKTLGATTVSYSDAGLTPKTTYNYSIQAVDAAGINSTLVTTNATTPSLITTLSFIPTNDAWIAQGRGNSNYGTDTSIHLDGSPRQDSLLMFTVSGIGTGTVSKAVLRLYCTNFSQASSEIHSASNNSWNENTVTWNNAPTPGASILATLAKVPKNSWISVNLTSLVQADGTYSLRLVNKHSDGVFFNSKEASSNRPILSVTKS